MSDSSEVVERIRFPELAAALQKDETLSNEARVKLVNLMNVYSPAHDLSYLKTVQTFVGKSLMARAVEQLIKDVRAPANPPMWHGFVDPIEDSNYNGERLEYLKRITMEEKPVQPKADIVFDDSDEDDPEPPPKKPKPVDEEPLLNTDDDCDDADPLPAPGKRLIAPHVPEPRHGGLRMIAPQHLARPDPPKKKPKLDHMELYGSHELVLTHHMQLPAGFTLETDEEQSLQFIVPNRQKPNELKSFRARLAKHLRAIGFVCLEDDAKKNMTECKLPGIHVPERLTHAWARETVDADGKDVSLDPHTLKVKFTGPDPVLQLDPLEYL